MNSAYWGDRLANEIWTQYNSLEEKNMTILNMYRDAEKDIIAEVAKLEARGNNLTRSQKYRINHLESLKKEIRKICEDIGDNVESSAKKGLFDAIKKNQENISSVLETTFSKPNQKAMEQMLNTPWHGSYFSQRLWKDTGKLANELNDIVKRGVTEGKTIAEMSFQLSNRLHASMNDVHRLVRTETINTLNRSTLDGYKKSGVNYIRWWAAEDERKCETCGANHGKIFPIDKAPVLPCHPNCRCTYIPVFDDELLDEDLTVINANSDDKLYNNVRWEDIKKYDDELSKMQSIKYFKEDCQIDFKDSKKYPIDVKVLNECVNWHKKFSKVFSTFEKVNPVKLPAINILPPSKMKNAMGYYSYYDENTKAVELAMNGKYVSDLKFLEAETLRMYKSGWQSGKSIAHTFIHEYGHHVSNSMKWIMDDSVWEAKFLNECIEDFRKDFPEIKGYWDLGEHLSNYGKSNVSECFAEAFAEYFGEEEPREFASLFGKKLEKILKGVK